MIRRVIATVLGALLMAGCVTLYPDEHVPPKDKKKKADVRSV